MDPPPSTTTAHPARITLLGTFRLIDRAQPISIAQPRLHTLLAFLALHPHTPQPRQRLAFLFWPDSTEAQAHTNLRQLLHLLRSAWPAANQYLRIDAKSVAWQAAGGFHSDVAEFEQTLAHATTARQAGRPTEARTILEAAVALYGGDLLPGCYDDWLLNERERLRRRWIDALEQLSVLCETARDYPAAIRHAQHLLRADPLHEAAYRHLMQLYLRNGDRAHALRTYHTCVTHLQQELGAPPSPETQAEYQRLLHQHAAPAQPPASALVSRAGLSLVGRDREWETLQHAWQHTLDHGVHFVCIVGEAGLGKTRLAEELLDWTRRQGIGHVYGRAYAAEGSLAYASVAEWLRADLFQAVWPHLPDLWLSEVARVRPELLIARPELPRPQPLTEAWQRQHYFEALARTILAAGQPLLLVLDDLQWCDPETLAWLHFLLRFDATAHLLVVGALRPEEVDERHPLTPLLGALRGGDRFTEIELMPLTASASATLAAQTAGRDLDATTLDDLYQISEGNPLFLVEMVRGQETARLRQARAAQEDPTPAVSAPNLPALPPKAQAIIARRLGQLSPAARELASVAAVIGRSFTVPVLAQASELGEEDLVPALDELWQRRLIREQGADEYDFSHDRIRDMAYATIRPARRRLLHRRAAAALESVYAGVLEPVLGELAAHYAEGGLVEPAVRWYREAAAAAKRLYAHAEAVSFLKRALQVVENSHDHARLAEMKIDLLHSLGYAHIVTDGWGSAPMGEAWEQALALARQSGTPFQLCRSLHVYSAFLKNHGKWRLYAQYDKEALRVAEEYGITDPYLLASIFGGLKTHAYHTGRFAQALDLYDTKNRLLIGAAVEPSFEWFGDTETIPSAREAMALWHLGYADQARAICRAELDYAANNTPITDSSEFVSDFAVYSFLLMIYVCLRDLVQVRILADKLFELSTQARYEHYLCDARRHIGYCLAHQGKTSEGLALVREGVEAMLNYGFQMFGPYDRALLAETLALAGEARQALEVVEEALASAAANDNVYWDAHLLRLKADALDALHAPAGDVEHWYLAALALAQSQGSRMLALRAATALGTFWQSQDRGQEAYDLLAPLYAEFTEGFDIPDLQDAAALLVALKP